MSRPARIAACLAALTVAACHNAVPSPTAVPVEVIYSATQCGSQDTEEQATYIIDAATLARSYAATRRLILSGDAPLPVVDFSREAALLVSMGTKPTAGYGMSLPADSARLIGDRLEIHLDWQSPPRGAVVAQALTSPCLILKIPRDGYKEVRILDRVGGIRARLNLP